MKMLRSLRKQKGISMKALGKEMGVSEGAISQYETGKREADYEMTLKIAEFFGVTVDYLLRGSAEATAVLRIPVLGSVPAGIPLEAIEDIVDWEEIPVSMANGDKAFFALQVKGDSMYPDYLPGDIVIVRKTPCCESGEDCVVYVNGYDATLKQVKLSDEGLTLLPRNPEYPPRTFTRDEVNSLPVTIAGVVVELRRKVGKGK